MLTECTAAKQCNTTGFYDHLKYLYDHSPQVENKLIWRIHARHHTHIQTYIAWKLIPRDWSNTYVNLQVGDQVRLELEVRVSKQWKLQWLIFVSSSRDQDVLPVR